MKCRQMFPIANLFVLHGLRLDKVLQINQRPWDRKGCLCLFLSTFKESEGEDFLDFPLQIFFLNSCFL